MSEDFVSIPNEGDNLSDLISVIRAKDSKFSVSTRLLMLKSTVLAQEVLKDMMEHNTQTIEIDETPDLVKEFVYFLYTDKVNSLESNAPILLPFSIKYGVKDLEKLCVDYLNKSMTEFNAFKRLELAVSCKNAELRTSSLEMSLSSYKTLEEFQEDLKTSK
ncbi:Speckle-type POZ protein A-like protein [Aphelenchoides bicaudatus]|nr:Speckle-type POZ protein A-like protein [Aphelenchoides bicaudatus]